MVYVNYTYKQVQLYAPEVAKTIDVASDWLRTFLHPGCFCLAYHYFNSGLQYFFNFHYRVIHQYGL